VACAILAAFLAPFAAGTASAVGDPATSATSIVAPTPTARIVKGLLVNIVVAMPSVLPDDLTQIHVVVDVDGVEVGSATADTAWSVDWDTTDASVGGHSLSAQVCTVVDSTEICGPMATSSVTVSPAPIIGLAANRRRISPNGDGRFDSLTLSIKVNVPMAVTLRLYDTARTLRGTWRLGNKVAGSSTAFVWAGRSSSGTRMPNGGYVFEATGNAGTAYAGANPVSIMTGIVVDTAPAGFRVGSTAVLYPFPDQYRDSVVVPMSITEASRVTLTIVNSAGSTVRKFATTTQNAGPFSLKWNGRNGAGHIVPAGKYRVHVVAVDSVGNVLRKTSGVVAVSAKRLIAFKYDRTVSGYASLVTWDSDYCSTVQSPAFSFTPPGSLGLLSGYFCVGDSMNVVTDHRVALPSAVKYGAVKVTVDMGMISEDELFGVVYSKSATTRDSAIFGSGSGLYSVSAGASGHAVNLSFVVVNVTWVWVNSIRVQGTAYKLA
jgi:flagellar hook assembly protein FlgD